MGNCADKELSQKIKNLESIVHGIDKKIDDYLKPMPSLFQNYIVKQISTTDDKKGITVSMYKESDVTENEIYVHYKNLDNSKNITDFSISGIKKKLEERVVKVIHENNQYFLFLIENKDCLTILDKKLDCLLKIYSSQTPLFNPFRAIDENKEPNVREDLESPQFTPKLLQLRFARIESYSDDGNSIEAGRAVKNFHDE